MTNMYAVPARSFATPGASNELSKFLAPSPTHSDDLPDPEPLIQNLTMGMLEVLSGMREVEQLARWLSEEAFRSLSARTALSRRARMNREAPAKRPNYRIRSVQICSCADNVVEAVAVVLGPQRARAVAIRLEGLDRRWRATSIALL